MPQESVVFQTSFDYFEKSTARLFKALKLKEVLSEKERKGEFERIVLKPNLTTALPAPCTTPAELVEVLVEWFQKNSSNEIIVAEGSGGCDSEIAFEKLGFKEMCKRRRVRLVDLNKAERTVAKSNNALKLKTLKLPKILFNSFLVNVPVLKEHDGAVTTCSMKNLFGIYKNPGVLRFLTNYWSKSKLHVHGVHESIFDLNLHCPISLAVVDASIGQKGNEIHGQAVKPPLKKMIAGFDAVAVDSFCSSLLGHDWKSIKYLKLANKKLGNAIEFSVKKA